MGRSMIPDSMPVVGDFTNNSQDPGFEVFGVGLHSDAKKEGVEKFELFGCSTGEVPEQVDEPVQQLATKNERLK